MVSTTTPLQATRARALSPTALSALNEGKSENARVSLERIHAFGPAMSISEYRLGNGLRVLALRDETAPVISYHTWFSVGSRHEKPGKTGLAHLFEHLMFNEVEGRPAGSFDRLVEEAGAESNAATWVDWTFYHEDIPREALGLIIELEAERMHKLVVRDPQVISEKEVVANERRYAVDDNIEGSINELLYKTAFTTHAYRWPTIGWMEDIQAFTTEDCVEFYRTFYAPNNATIVAVGDFRERDLLSKIQAAYGHIEPSTLPIEDVRPEPPQKGERRLSINKPTPTSKLTLAYRGPAFGDVDHVPLTMLAEILFAGRSSRAYRSLVQEQEIATEVRGWVSTFRDPGLFEIYATLRPGKRADEIIEPLLIELQRVIDEPVSVAELEKVKARVELSLLHSLDTANGKAEQIGFYDTVIDDPAGAFSRLDAYRRTTVTDILRAARRYLLSSQRTIIEVYPEASTAVEGSSE